MSAPADPEPRRPTDLRVEYEADPANVDPTRPPRFSWRIDTDRRGARQTGYRIVVARERADAAAGRATVWDSGRVESRRATTVDYGGPDVASDATYHWSVKCWTDAGETDWAEPATFATALEPEDWRGEWIAHQPGTGDTSGWRSRWRAPDAAGEPWVRVDLGESRRIAAIELHPAEPVEVVRTPEDVAVTTSWDADPIAEFGFPERYRIEVADDPGFDDPEVVVDAAGDDAIAGAGAAAEGADGAGTDDGGSDDSVTGDVRPRRHDGVDATGRYVRVAATDPWVRAADAGRRSREGVEGRLVEPTGSWAVFALAGLAVRDADGTDLAEDRPVAATSSVETDTWGRDHLVNGHLASRTASSSPLLRTGFSLDRPVRSARLHVAGVGYAECYLDGDRVGDRRLDPAWTEYEDRVLYASHDVTDRLSPGDHALGLWLGRGRFAQRSAYWVGDGSPRARAVLTVEYEDGSTTRLSTDGNWQATESPIVENDVFDGERYDARREVDGWAEPGGVEDPEAATGGARWDAATLVDAPGGTLRPERIEPMAVVESLDVDAVHDHPDGPILDFGQNLTGWVEIEVRNPDPGDEVTLRHAEALTDHGDLSTVDLRTADATDTYVARGGEVETYEPRFTYHGFRYAQVSGSPGEFDPDRATAKVVHTAMDRRGSFACSNDDLNRVQHNAVWGLRGNAHSIPEDCPQRDERFGWTGDAQIATRALLFNFDAVRFHEKWARDHDDAASPMGYVPDVIPNKGTEDPADPTWSVTRVLCPWYLYRHDGDERVLRDHYEDMRAYVDYWLSVTDEDGVVPGTYGKFGDWLAFENADGRRGLPHDLFDTAYVYRVTDAFAAIASVLGNDADAAAYRERADRIAAGFHDRFFDPERAVYGPGTQSSFAVPLFLGLVPEDRVDDVVAGLVEKVRADGSKLQTGFLGTRALLHALADDGHADLAYEVASQPERPGWVYMARNGATTVWERWDSDDRVGSGMNSLDHSPFTHVSEFFYEVLAGIRVGDRPATEHVTVAPRLVDDLEWVDASLETRNGDLAVSWERTTGADAPGGDGSRARDASGASGDRTGSDPPAYDLTVTVPWNTTATVRLPGGADAAVAESGDDLAEGSVAGVRSVDADDGGLVVEVGTGTYAFEVS